MTRDQMPRPASIAWLCLWAGTCLLWVAIVGAAVVMGWLS